MLFQPVDLGVDYVGQFDRDVLVVDGHHHGSGWENCLIVCVVVKVVVTISGVKVHRDFDQISTLFWQLDRFKGFHIIVTFVASIPIISIIWVYI